jgi:hypothetical protein
MSLNRLEQLTADYLEGHPDERQHWQAKVRTLGANEADPHDVAVRLERELWAYVVERSGVAAPFRAFAAHAGLKRTSLRNLAELMIRQWLPPKPKKQASGVDR